MLKREYMLLWPYDGPAPDATRQLEREGHCVLQGVFSDAEVRALHREISAVYAEYPADLRGGASCREQAEVFRYQRLNRSALSQNAMAHARILEVVEPLLGSDCHAINSTAWRNPPGLAAVPEDYHWHVDGGPHVPRSAGVEWPDAIPYPIFVIAAHVYLDDCALADGPTTVVPGSHRSGQPPPYERRFDADLEHAGRRAVAHVVRAGNVGFFVSDVWHRRTLPTARSKGRFFLQTNYGRRDIAQRILPTAEVNHTCEAARARATTERERTLLGLHPNQFYDG